MVSGTCPKIILIAVNVIAALLGAAAIGLGIWSLTSDYGANELVALTGSALFTATCVMILVGGVLIFIVAFLGCFGAIFENKSMLGAYSIIMITFFIFIIVGGVLAFFFKDEIEEQLSDQMDDALIKQYGVNVSIEDNEAVTKLWDTIQKGLKCCGIRGSYDSDKSWYRWQSSLWFQEEGTIGAKSNWWFVPNSCCNSAYTFPNCRQTNASNGQPPKEVLSDVTEDNPAMYSEGCLEKLKDAIKDHIVAMVVVAFILLAVMIVCVISAVCLCMVGRQMQHVI